MKSWNLDAWRARLAAVPRWCVDALLLGALCVCLAYTWMSPSVSAPNERSRAYLAHAMVSRGEVTIDKEVSRWGKIFDIAKKDGHFYSDKAPGSSVLLAPILAASDTGDSIELAVQRGRSWVVLPMAMAGAVALLALLHLLGVHAWIARFCVTGLMLGTSVLHYGHAFFGHVPVMACGLIALAMFLAARTRAEEDLLAALACALGGFACGLAFMIEYQAVVLTVGLGAGLLLDRETRRWRVILPAMAGGLLPVLCALGYNHVAFGSPFSTSYDFLYHAKSIALHEKGIGGVTTPGVGALTGLILGPHRGLVFCAPMVLLGAMGLASVWRRARWLAVTIGFWSLAYLYIASSIDIWYAGWGFGPRLLIPMMGPLAIAFACKFEDSMDASGAFCGVGIGATLGGILHNVLVTSAWPEIPEKIINPLQSVALPLLSRGDVTANLGVTWLGLAPARSVWPMFLLAASCVVIVATGAYLVISERRRALVAILSSLLLFGWVALAIPEPHPKKKVEKFVDWAAKQRRELR